MTAPPPPPPRIGSCCGRRSSRSPFPCSSGCCACGPTSSIVSATATCGSTSCLTSCRMGRPCGRGAGAGVRRAFSGAPDATNTGCSGGGRLCSMAWGWSGLGSWGCSASLCLNAQRQHTPGTAARCSTCSPGARTKPPMRQRRAGAPHAGTLCCCGVQARASVCDAACGLRTHLQHARRTPDTRGSWLQYHQPGPPRAAAR